MNIIKLSSKLSVVKSLGSNEINCSHKNVYYITEMIVIAREVQMMNLKDNIDKRAGIETSRRVFLVYMRSSRRDLSRLPSSDAYSSVRK